MKRQVLQKNTDCESCYAIMIIRCNRCAKTNFLEKENTLPKNIVT